MALPRKRQRHRHRREILQEPVPDLQAAAQQRRVSRYGDRSGDVQEDCRAARWPHLDRIGARARQHLPLHLAGDGGAVMTGRPIEILLVEDNPGDVRLTREALNEAHVRNNLTVAKAGAEALAMARREPPYDAAPRPDLVLLDLNLPRLDGRQVLAEMKADPELRRIPVVVLTTSKAEEDVLRSYDLYANSYITKPVDFEQFIKVVHSIEEFWLSIVTLSGK